MFKTCIIIPCYNEERRLPAQDFLSFCNANRHITFCFVNDGSKDGTLLLLEALCRKNPQQTILVSMPKNEGKAEAVRQGMQIVCNDTHGFMYVGYFDADLAAPLNEIHLFLNYFERHPDCIFVLGSRVKRLGSSIHRSTMRHVLGRALATVFGFYFKIPVYDSQCGAKLMHVSLARKMFNVRFVSKWLFDVELILKANKVISSNELEGYIYEKPMSVWREVKASKIRATDMFGVFRDIYFIKQKYFK